MVRLTESWFGGNTDDTRLSVWLHSFNTWPYTLQTNTTGLCQSFNLWNEIINRDEKIICKNINVKDVTVNSGKKLILESVGGTITIGSNVTAQTGATLEIRGTISISDLRRSIYCKIKIWYVQAKYIITFFYYIIINLKKNVIL